MEEQTTPTKGRKFIALQEALGICILYIGACIYDEKLADLSGVVMTAMGIAAAYMGANAWKATKQ